MAKQLPSYKAPHFMVFTVKRTRSHNRPLPLRFIKNISIFTKRPNNENCLLMQHMKQAFSKFKHYLKIRIQENLFVHLWCETQLLLCLK